MLRRLLLALALSLLTTPLFAAWANVGAMAVGNSTANSATLVVATSATLEAGNVGVCVVVADEGGAGTTDGVVGRIITMTDAAGNTWINGTEAGGTRNEHCNMNTTNTANGSCVAVFYTLATVQLNSGANITATFTSAIVAKALTCQEFTVTAGATLSEALGTNGLSNDAADPGSLTAATTVAIQHLFIRGSGCESNVTTYTADADYTVFTGSTTTSTANTGTLLTSQGSRGEYRIATEASSAASDPTYTAADCASIIIGINQTDPASTTHPGWTHWW